MRMHKKGALELSINAIVIVILAMTLLGLGLGFIKGMFGNINDITIKVSDETKTQILDTLRRTDQKLAFPSNEVNLERGKSEILVVGVKNNLGSGELKFNISAEVLEGKDQNGGTIAQTSDITYFYDSGGGDGFKLGVSEANVFPLKIQAKSSATKGVYRAKITINQIVNVSGVVGISEYAAKPFFINII